MPWRLTPSCWLHLQPWHPVAGASDLTWTRMRTWRYCSCEVGWGWAGEVDLHPGRCLGRTMGWWRCKSLSLNCCRSCPLGRVLTLYSTVTSIWRGSIWFHYRHASWHWVDFLYQTSSCVEISILCLCSRTGRTFSVSSFGDLRRWRSCVDGCCSSRSDLHTAKTTRDQTRDRTRDQTSANNNDDMT